uniref:Prominin 2 n=1 Tax=Amazona collaria TaxID=241587 RepID=A0A8B9GG15_9PSIT
GSPALSMYSPLSGLLLAWALLRPAGTQQCHLAGPGGVLRFTDTHAEIRVPALHRVPSSLDPLYGLVRRCLDLVQQNPLPTGETRSWGPQGFASGGAGMLGYRSHGNGTDPVLVLSGLSHHIGGAPAAVRGPPACPPALTGLPPPLPAGLPVPHLPHHPVSPHSTLHPCALTLNPILWVQEAPLGSSITSCSSPAGPASSAPLSPARG